MAMKICDVHDNDKNKDRKAKKHERENIAPQADNPEEVISRTYTKPGLEEIKKKLTNTQYLVTQSDGTEKPFVNEYWNNHKDGLYVDVVTGEPLFSSRDKYDSGTGWPSFTKPVASDAVITKTDTSLLMERVEVRSRYGDSHLGHLFNDGPQDRGGRRYCMNSAALKFIPLNKMEEEGYGEFIPLIK